MKLSADLGLPRSPTTKHAMSPWVGNNDQRNSLLEIKGGSSFLYLSSGERNKNIRHGFFFLVILLFIQLK